MSCVCAPTGTFCMSILKALACAAALSLALPMASLAADPPPALTPLQLNIPAILPPPPVEGSPEAVAETAQVRAILAARTDAQYAKAEWDAEIENVFAISESMGKDFLPIRLPATVALFEDVRVEAGRVAKLAKAHYKRLRPWAVDPAIKGCEQEHDKPDTGYPSGHATMAFSTGVILAHLAPEHAEAIMARAADYSRQRLVCGDHRLSDVVAGQALGAVVAMELMHDPAIQQEMKAAEAELKAAHLVQ